jgi:excisionase family DNA binding protein
MSRRVVEDRELERLVHRAVAEAFAAERKARARSGLKSVIKKKSTADAPKVPQFGFATVIQIARYLNVSKSTIYRAVDAGELGSTTIGETIRVKWEEVHALHRFQS